MIKLRPLITDDINIPVKKGDTILGGKWKNKRIKIKSISHDEHDMPTINGRKVVNFRIPKEPVEEGEKMDRLGGRYGGEPDFAVASPGANDTKDAVVNTSKKGGTNRGEGRTAKPRSKHFVNEATAQGEVQVNLLKALQGTRGRTFQLTDLARLPDFRGVSFKRLMNAAGALDAKGLLKYSMSTGHITSEGVTDQNDRWLDRAEEVAHKELSKLRNIANEVIQEFKATANNPDSAAQSAAAQLKSTTSKKVRPKKVPEATEPWHSLEGQDEYPDNVKVDADDHDDGVIGPYDDDNTRVSPAEDDDKDLKLADMIPEDMHPLSKVIKLTPADMKAARPYIPSSVMPGSGEEIGYVYGVRDAFSGKPEPSDPNLGGAIQVAINKGFRAARSHTKSKNESIKLVTMIPEDARVFPRKCENCRWFIKDMSMCGVIKPPQVSEYGVCDIWHHGDPSTSDQMFPQQRIEAKDVHYVDDYHKHPLNNAQAHDQGLDA
jgi:hypothetical protein